ncbi:hypothetical protein [Micrococcus sp.]|uniref:hypothetical protein n=1 Tax=Micrococcus sp. TaxID=1271 RepID=UPI002A90D8DC|nr:hypothetical protein [Micrococcus sp.]MDY6056084.1 hypothetical protein [Micrococcus sp.]
MVIPRLTAALLLGAAALAGAPAAVAIPLEQAAEPPSGAVVAPLPMADPWVQEGEGVAAPTGMVTGMRSALCRRWGLLC